MARRCRVLIFARYESNDGHGGPPGRRPRAARPPGARTGPAGPPPSLNAQPDSDTPAPGGWLAANAGLVATMFLWGTLIPLLSYLLRRWDPYLLALVRNALAVPVLWLLLAVLERRHPLPIAISRWRLLALGSAFAGFSYFYTLGIAHSNVITAAVIAAASPLVASLMVWASTRVAPTRAERLAMALAVAGGAAALVNWTGGSLPRLAVRGGEPLLVLASACWSWYSLFNQRWLAGVSQLRITTLTLTAGSLVLLVTYLLLLALGVAHGPPAHLRLDDFVLIAWAVLGAVVAGLFLWNFGVSRLGVLVATMYANLIPVVAITIGVLMGATARPGQLLGGVLVIAGVVQAQLRRRRV